MIKTDNDIYKIEDSDKDDIDLKEYCPGWYFTDETENFVGPYNSRQEALDASVSYGKWLNEEASCSSCGHSLRDNQHGFDQNDAYLEDDSTSEAGYKLVHSGRCTYCKYCNPGILEATKS